MQISHPACQPMETLLADCEMRFTRRSGPGGQHRNKTSTAVVLKHIPTEIVAEASERRSQAENREQAVRRLRLALAVGVRIPPSEEGPSALWKRRCHEGRVAVNPRHVDYPAILAEALDRIAACRGDVGTASTELGCTTTQLVKLVRTDSDAFRLVNAWRRESGQHALK